MRLPKEVAMWEERFERCKQARLTKEEQWYLNLAFYFGKQYAQWEKSGATNRLVEPAVPRSRVRLISNKIRPAIRREVTKLCKEEAQFYCVPNTTEQEDVMGAKVAESMADFVLDQSGFNKKRRSATWWASVTGTGFIKSYCATPNGPIIYENKTPFHIYVPYIQIEEMEDQPYVFDCQAVTAQKVYDQYGVELEPDSYADSSTLEQRFFNAMGIKTDSTTKDLVYVKEIWVKPCKDYPTGAMLVLAGKKIVHAYAGIPKEVDPEDTGVYIPSAEKLSVSDYPFEHNKFPFDKISHIPSGTFYGGSVIDDVIPLQKEYNRARSQITEAKNKTAKPQMAYQKGSIEPNKMTSEPGLLIAVNPGFEYPHYMIPGEYPSYAIMDQDRIVGDINEVTSQGEISRGTTPPGVEAASAIAYLQEQNDDILYWTIAQIEDAVASVGRKTLSLVQQFWDESKIVNIVSKNNSYETMIFKASDINGNVDLRVEAQSMAPRSRAAKQAFITGLMKDGLLPPEKGLRYLQMNETNRLYEELQADSKQAQRENWLMKNGQPLTPVEIQAPEGMMGQQQMPMGQMDQKPQIDPNTGQPVPQMPPSTVNDFDNHATHMYEHALYMKSQEYMQLAVEIRDTMLNHWREHQVRSDMQMQIQQAQGADPATQGVPA